MCGVDGNASGALCGDDDARATATVVPAVGGGMAGRCGRAVRKCRAPDSYQAERLHRSIRAGGRDVGPHIYTYTHTHTHTQA